MKVEFSSSSFKSVVLGLGVVMFEKARSCPQAFSLFDAAGGSHTKACGGGDAC